MAFLTKHSLCSWSAAPDMFAFSEQMFLNKTCQSLVDISFWRQRLIDYTNQYFLLTIKITLWIRCHKLVDGLIPPLRSDSITKSEQNFKTSATHLTSINQLPPSNLTSVNHLDTDVDTLCHSNTSPRSWVWILCQSWRKWLVFNISFWWGLGQQ